MIAQCSALNRRRWRLWAEKRKQKRMIIYQPCVHGEAGKPAAYRAHLLISSASADKLARRVYRHNSIAWPLINAGSSYAKEII